MQTSAVLKNFGIGYRYFKLPSIKY